MLKNKLTANIILHVFTFFYLYSVQLKGMPVGTRIVLAGFGLVIMIFNAYREFKNKRDIGISRQFIGYLIFFAAIIIVSLFSIFLNDTSDLEFVKYPVSIFLIIAAAYFIRFLLLKSCLQFTVETVMRLIVNAVLIQNLIASISFISPAIDSFLLSIQSFDQSEASHVEQALSFRLIGFGASFFGAGIINGFALMCLSFLIKNKNNSGLKVFILSFKFFLIFVLGMMMARSTLIGFGLAILFLLKPSFYVSRSIARNIIRFFVGIFLIPVLFILVLTTFFPQTVNNLMAAANFGFELFINYYNKGEFTSASTSDLQTLYVFPKSVKTYVIGDAHYYNKPGDVSSGYYMATDVGFLRMIYYFGIIGLLIYFLLQLAVTRSAFVLNNEVPYFKTFLFFAFLYCIILNFKGFTDIFFLMILFCHRYKTVKEANFISAA